MYKKSYNILILNQNIFLTIILLSGNLTNLILKKFKKDLNNEKLNLLKGKEMNIKKEKCKIKELSCNEIADTNSFDMLIGNNFNQACEDKSEKEVIESKKFQNNIELFDQKSSVTSINNCTELNSMKSFDEWNEEIKKTDEENSKPPEKYLLSMKTNEKKVVHNKIEHFKTEALGTELVPGNLPPVEDNIQVISDFSNTKTESDKTSGSETCLLKNQKIIENSAIKINNVEFKDPPAVNCENSNLIEICSVPEKNSKNQLNTLPNSLSEKEKLELIDCGMNCSATNNSTEQSNSILHSVNKLKNDFAYQQGDFPPNFIKCKLENKVSSAWPNADSNIDSSVNFNKASESSMNSNNKSLNMHLGTKHLCDIEKIEKNNNKHINNIKNSSQKHCSGSEVVPSEVQMLPVFSRSILDVPHTEVESIHQFRDGNLNSIATLSSQEKKVASVEVFTYDNNSLNCDLFDYSNLEREIIPEISQNGVNNEENVDILESEKISFENLNNKTIINSLSKSLELEFSFEKKSEEVALEDSDLCDEERTKIFSEMTNVRLLSPIRDVSEKNFVTFETWQSKKDKHSPNKSFTMSAESDHNFYSDKKRDNTHCDTKKSKKFKLDEMTGKNNEGKSACGLLDSIMSAMSIQNKEFKSNAFRKGNLTNETSVGSDKNCGMQFPTACNKSNLDLVKLKSKNLVQKMDVKPDISNETRSFEIFQTTKKNYGKYSRKFWFFVRFFKQKYFINFFFSHR